MEVTIMMRITYYHGGFGGDITDNVFDGIKFIFDNDSHPKNILLMFLTLDVLKLFRFTCFR